MLTPEQAVEIEEELCSNAQVAGGIFIALGSNIGDRASNILRAAEEIGRAPTTSVIRLSPLYESEPVGGIPQADFINAVLEASSALTAQQLLAELLRIETGVFGRQRGQRWGPRSIDLDLIFYGSTVIDTPPQLQLPHPRAHERRFVLAPLADIAPSFVHPILGRRVDQLLAELPPGGNLYCYKG